MVNVHLYYELFSYIFYAALPSYPKHRIVFILFKMKLIIKFLNAMSFVYILNLKLLYFRKFTFMYRYVYK